jgi:hypothetical protein
MSKPDLLSHIAVRWNDPDPKHAPLLGEGGITAVISPSDDSFTRACTDAGIKVIPQSDIAAVSIDDAAKAQSGVIKAGVWPGVHRPDPQTASATRSLWLDQNCSFVQYSRTMFPQLQPVLGYLPDKDAGVTPERLVPYDSHELALAEAWVSGGNYLIALEPRFREGLLKGAQDALTAWRSLGRTARWLRANETLFRQKPLPLVKVLVDSGFMSQEVAHLMFRQSVSPCLIPADQPPAPDPSRCLALAAVSIEPPPEAARKQILANAAAGSAVIVEGEPDKAWWRTPGLKHVRSDAEREFYSLGKGQVVAYKKEVEDPGSFALDVIDIVTQKRRPARLWNCNAGIAIASLAPGGRGAVLNAVNYSRPQDLPVLARVQGNYERATLLQPEAEKRSLEVHRRGTASEVSIPFVGRVGTVVFE